MSGDFNRWITRFEDQVKVCETIGVVLTEEAKVFYFMNNLNDTIFGTVKANFMELSTRILFPDTYDEIKQRIIAEYGQITSRKPQTVLKVIKGEDTKRHGEATNEMAMLARGVSFYRPDDMLTERQDRELDKLIEILVSTR